MESSHVTERRRHPRLGLEFDVQMQPLDPPASAGQPVSDKALSRDVSESGIRVWASRSYPINAAVLLTFECPEMGWNNITSRVGLVVWAEDLRGEGRYLLGIRFSEGDRVERVRIA